MDRKTFQAALARTLYPRLRVAHFRGTGTTRRRRQGPVVHVANVQGSLSGLGCYLNLGVHLDGLKGPNDSPPCAEPMEYACILRRRIEPPHDIGNDMGPYGVSALEASKNAQCMADAFVNDGEAFLAPYSHWPDDFRAIVLRAATADFPGAHPLDLIHLAEYCDMPTERLAIAQRALADVPAFATGFRKRLEGIVGSGAI